MRKLIVVVLLLSTLPVCAGNKKRIDELQKERTVLSQRLDQYNQVVQKIQVRLIQINAVIQELENMNSKKKKSKKK